jgi:hypothetical protein
MGLIVKDHLSTLDQAFQAAKANGKLSEATTAGDLVKNIAYIAKDNTSLLANNFINCADTNVTCLKLDNGGSILAYANEQTFGVLDEEHYINFTVDPDADGPEAAVSLLLLGNGKLVTGKNASNYIQGDEGLPVITVDPEYVDPEYIDPELNGM